MRSVIFVIMLTAASSALASEVPNEFLGEWVPQTASCQSKLKFRVEPNRVILQNRGTKKVFSDIDICYSCEGGAHYNGKVAWLTPEFNSKAPAPFTAYFNAGEMQGVTKLEIRSSEIQKIFPLNNVALKNCK